MATRRLAFYDHHRQRYAAVAPIRKRGVAHEFGVGFYAKDGGVYRGGEITIELHDLQPWRDEALSARVCAFDDGFGAVRRLERDGVLRAIERAEIRGPDDLSRLLLKHGLRDDSDKPLAS